MTQYEIINTMVTIFSSLLIAIPIFLVIKQIKISIEIHKENHDFQRRLATVEALAYIRDIDTSDLIKEFNYVNLDTPLSLKKIKKSFKKNPELRNTFFKIINNYTALANGIVTGVYEEKIIKINRRGTMRRDFKMFEEYIVYRRKKRGNPNIWIGCEKLLDNWDNEDYSSNKLEKTGFY